MDIRSFRSLSSRHKALVSVAVLLDGREASVYLENDIEDGKILQKSARELAGLDIELRVPLAGTALRRALESLES